MQNDVIAYKFWRLDQTPIQGNRSTFGTGTPAGALIADGNMVHGEIMSGGQFQDSRGQFSSGNMPQVTFDGGPQIS
jgi:hypothetical protein